MPSLSSMSTSSTSSMMDDCVSAGVVVTDGGDVGVVVDASLSASVTSSESSERIAEEPVGSSCSPRLALG